MLGRGVLSRLHCLTQQDSNTLTLYVSLDQGARANRNGGFVVQAEALLSHLRSEHEADPALERAAGRAAELISGVEPQGRAAVVVVHGDTGLEEIHQVGVSFPSSVYWRRGAFLRPVVEAMDEHERYGVILADSKRARLFTVYLGEITEHRHLWSDTGGRAKAVGVDQWRAEKRQQRHHDEELAAHAKRVIDAIRDLGLEAPFDRLIVAGPQRAASQIVRLLPKRLHGKLVETLSLPVGAPERDVLKGILEVQKRMERGQEARLVEGLLSELHEGGRAVAGLEEVSAVVSEMRVWTLFYDQRLDAEGGECRDCGIFTTKTSGFCPRCRAGLEPVGMLVDRLAQVVLETGGRVEAVAGAPAEDLRAVGSIGALLRY
ncbi:MAG: host attachment protein [Thermoanaerobaculales bacterium]|nr:host attachment protein [Thermoanaerobaculales bacterium]